MGNTCESVIISLGGRTRACREACSLSVVQLITKHFLSNSSRMVCTCGRMRRPLGACISWGITSRTTSPSLTQLPVIVCSPKFSGSFSRIASKMPWMPVPSLALTTTGACPHSFSIRSTTEAVSWRESALFSISITGISRAASSFSHCCSSVPSAS